MLVGNDKQNESKQLADLITRWSISLLILPPNHCVCVYIRVCVRVCVCVNMAETVLASEAETRL